MNKELGTKEKYFLAGSIILAAIATRLIPHMPNAAPITALAIFAAAVLPIRQAIAIPLAVRFISDLLLGFFAWPLMLAVYGAHSIGILFGLWIKGDASPSAVKIVTSSMGASAIFFLVTNFAFLYGNAYPHTWTGIISAYVNGLPFLRGTMAGDLGYGLFLFGTYELIVYAYGTYSSRREVLT